MKQSYQNDLLGWSKEEIKKEWENCWDKIQALNPIKDTKELVELNRQFDKCVEAYYAVDCGNYWQVRSASRVMGSYMTYKVMKPMGQRQEHIESKLGGFYVELEN